MTFSFRHIATSLVLCAGLCVGTSALSPAAPLSTVHGAHSLSSSDITDKDDPRSPTPKAGPIPGRHRTIPTPGSDELATVARYYPDPVHRFIRSHDGLRVSVYEYGKPASQADTIVMTGGYPWTSSGMDPIARILGAHYHVVRYDQRGSGESTHPDAQEKYTLENLAMEMYSVIRATTPQGTAVHVFGEAWCPFIASQLSVMKPNVVASLTSLGAPSIDVARHAVAAAEQSSDPAQRRRARQQNAGIAYIRFMQKHPDTYRKIAGSGAIPKASNFALTLVGGDFDGRINTYDMYYGMNKYVTSFRDHWDSPKYDFLPIPVVHVLHMTGDFVETDLLIEGLEKHVPNYLYHDLDANHVTWILYAVSLTDYVHQSIQTYHRLP